MAAYTFIFQAQSDSTVAFSWQVGQDAPTTRMPITVVEGDSVAISLLAEPETEQTMASLTLTFNEKQSGEPVSPFLGQGASFTWNNGGPDLTVVETNGDWCFAGILTATNPTKYYTLADPEMQVGDGDPEESLAQAA